LQQRFGIFLYFAKVEFVNNLKGFALYVFVIHVYSHDKMIFIRRFHSSHHYQ